MAKGGRGKPSANDAEMAIRIQVRTHFISSPSTVSEAELTALEFKGEVLMIDA
jgi:hypothetical protein